MIKILTKSIREIRRSNLVKEHMVKFQLLSIEKLGKNAQLKLLHDPRSRIGLVSKLKSRSYKLLTIQMSSSCMSTLKMMIMFILSQSFVKEESSLIGLLRLNTSLKKELLLYSSRSCKL